MRCPHALGGPISPSPSRGRGHRSGEAVLGCGRAQRYIERLATLMQLILTDFVEASILQNLKFWEMSHVYSSRHHSPLGLFIMHVDIPLFL